MSDGPDTLPDTVSATPKLLASPLSSTADPFHSIDNAALLSSRPHASHISAVSSLPVASDWIAQESAVTTSTSNALLPAARPHQPTESSLPADMEGTPNGLAAAAMDASSLRSSTSSLVPATPGATMTLDDHHPTLDRTADASRSRQSSQEVDGGGDTPSSGSGPAEGSISSTNGARKRSVADRDDADESDGGAVVGAEAQRSKPSPPVPGGLNRAMVVVSSPTDHAGPRPAAPGAILLPPPSLVIAAEDASPPHPPAVAAADALTEEEERFRDFSNAAPELVRSIKDARAAVYNDQLSTNQRLDAIEMAVDLAQQWIKLSPRYPQVWDVPGVVDILLDTYPSLLDIWKSHWGFHEADARILPDSVRPLVTLLGAFPERLCTHPALKQLFLAIYRLLTDQSDLGTIMEMDDDPYDNTVLPLLEKATLAGMHRIAHFPALPLPTLAALLTTIYQLYERMDEQIDPIAPSAGKTSAHPDHEYNHNLQLDVMEQLVIKLQNFASDPGVLDDELRALSRDNLLELLTVSQRLCEGVYSHQVRRELAKACCSCSVLDRRLFGVELIKDMITRDLHQTALQATDTAMTQSNPPTTTEHSSVYEWMQQERIISRMLVEAPHPELIQRSQNVLSLVFRDAIIAPEELDGIWALLGGSSHSTVRNAVAHLIAQGVHDMPPPALLDTLQRFHSLNMQSLDAPMLEILYQAMSAALKQVESSFFAESQGNAGADAAVSQARLLVENTQELVWDIVQDESKVPVAFKTEILQRALDTIFNPHRGGVCAPSLLERAMANLLLAESVTPSALLLSAVLPGQSDIDPDHLSQIRELALGCLCQMAEPTYTPLYALSAEFVALAKLLLTVAGAMPNEAPLTMEEAMRLWSALANTPLLQAQYFGWIEHIFDTQPHHPNAHTVANVVLNGALTVSPEMRTSALATVVRVALDHNSHTYHHDVQAQLDFAWQLLVLFSASTADADDSAMAMGSMSLLLVDLALLPAPEQLALSMQHFVSTALARLALATDAPAFLAILQVLKQIMAAFDKKYPSVQVSSSQPAHEGAQNLAVTHRYMARSGNEVALNLVVSGAESPHTGKHQIHVSSHITLDELKNKVAVKFDWDPAYIRMLAFGTDVSRDRVHRTLAQAGLADGFGVSVMLLRIGAPIAPETATTNGLSAPHTSPLIGPLPPALPTREASPTAMEVDVPASATILPAQKTNDNDNLVVLSESGPVPAENASPRHIIMQTECFDMLFALLSCDEARAKSVYAFLQDLPTSQLGLRTLETDTGVAVGHLLDPTVPFRYLYSLELLEHVLYHMRADQEWISSQHALSLVAQVARNLGHAACPRTPIALQLLTASLGVLSGAIQLGQLGLSDAQVLLDHLSQFVVSSSNDAVDVAPRVLEFLVLCLSKVPDCNPTAALAAIDRALGHPSSELRASTTALLCPRPPALLPVSIRDHLLSQAHARDVPNELFEILQHLVSGAQHPLDAVPPPAPVLGTPIMTELVTGIMNSLSLGSDSAIVPQKLDLLAAAITPDCVMESLETVHAYGISLYDHLYPSDLSHVAAPYNRPETRAAALRLLGALASVCPQLASYIHDQLLALLVDDLFLTRDSWEWDSAHATRSSFVGLENAGSVCYQNSLLQQLFMDETFRRTFLSCEPSPDHIPEIARVESHGKSKADPLAQSTVRQLQRLFVELQESASASITTTSFINTLRTPEGQAVNVYVQQDVDEFYNMLFDRIEAEMKGSPQAELLDERFGGKLVHLVESRECEHVSAREEPYHALQCEVKGKASLLDSLHTYIAGDLLAGDNKYHCSQCDKLVDAVKSTRIGTLPTNLVLHLKRFDFSLITFERQKVNDRFEFPRELDMAEFMAPRDTTIVDDGGTVYDLNGVLVHTGTSDTGHYYSYICDQATGSWHQFNDSMVTPFDPSTLPEVAFGGDCPHSAYMLFYRRRGADQQQHAGGQALAEPRLPPYYDAHRAEIVANNAEVSRDMYLHEHELAQLIFRLSNGHVSPRLVMAYALRVAVYSRDHTYMVQATSVLASSPISEDAADWLADRFIAGQWNSVARMVIDNAVAEHRHLTGKMLEQVVVQHARPEKRTAFAGLLVRLANQVSLRRFWNNEAALFDLIEAMASVAPLSLIGLVASVINVILDEHFVRSGSTHKTILTGRTGADPMVLARIIFKVLGGSAPAEIRNAHTLMSKTLEDHTRPFYLTVISFGKDPAEVAALLTHGALGNFVSDTLSHMISCLPRLQHDRRLVEFFGKLCLGLLRSTPRITKQIAENTMAWLTWAAERGNGNLTTAMALELVRPVIESVGDAASRPALAAVVVESGVEETRMANFLVAPLAATRTAALTLLSFALQSDQAMFQCLLHTLAQVAHKNNFVSVLTVVEKLDELAQDFLRAPIGEDPSTTARLRQLVKVAMQCTLPARRLLTVDVLALLKLIERILDHENAPPVLIEGGWALFSRPLADILTGDMAAAAEQRLIGAAYLSIMRVLERRYCGEPIPATAILPGAADLVLSSWRFEYTQEESDMCTRLLRTVVIGQSGSHNGVVHFLQRARNVIPVYIGPLMASLDAIAPLPYSVISGLGQGQALVMVINYLAKMQPPPGPDLCRLLRLYLYVRGFQHRLDPAAEAVMGVIPECQVYASSYQLLMAIGTPRLDLHLVETMDLAEERLYESAALATLTAIGRWLTGHLINCNMDAHVLLLESLCTTHEELVLTGLASQGIAGAVLGAQAPTYAAVVAQLTETADRLARLCERALARQVPPAAPVSPASPPTTATTATPTSAEPLQAKPAREEDGTDDEIDEGVKAAGEDAIVE